MTFLLTFLIFSAAMFIAGYIVWHAPQQQAHQALAGRLRELRARSASGRRPSAASDLVLRPAGSPVGLLSDFVSWLGLLRRLQEFIAQADLSYRAGNVVLLSLLLTALSYLVFSLFTKVLILRWLFALLCGAAPLSYIWWVRNRRLRQLEAQLPDALDLFVRSTQAGHNIHAGLETIAAESPDPLRKEFRKVVEELALGSPLEPALHGLGRRVPLVDLKFFIIGLILQRQTGANMVTVLENLSLLIRERLNLAAKMKAATAQQRFSAGLLCALPLVVGLGFWILKPKYIELLFTDPTGSKFLTYAVISELIGILIIRRIASPKL